MLNSRSPQTLQNKTITGIDKVVGWFPSQLGFDWTTNLYFRHEMRRDNSKETDLRSRTNRFK